MSINKYVFFFNRLFSILLFCRWLPFTYLLIFSTTLKSETIYFSPTYLQVFDQCENKINSNGQAVPNTSISKFVTGDYYHSDYLRKGTLCAGFNYNMYQPTYVGQQLPTSVYQTTFITGDFETLDLRFKAYCMKAKEHFFSELGDYSYAPNGEYLGYTSHLSDDHLFWGFREIAPPKNFVSPFLHEKELALLRYNEETEGYKLSYSSDFMAYYFVKCQSNSLTTLFAKLYAFDYELTECADNVLEQKFNDKLNEYYATFKSAFNHFNVTSIEVRENIDANCSSVLNTCRHDVLYPIFNKINWLFPFLAVIYAFLMVFDNGKN